MALELEHHPGTMLWRLYSSSELGLLLFRPGGRFDPVARQDAPKAATANRADGHDVPNQHDFERGVRPIWITGATHPAGFDTYDAFVAHVRMLSERTRGTLILLKVFPHSGRGGKVAGLGAELPSVCTDASNGAPEMHHGSRYSPERAGSLALSNVPVAHAEESLGVLRDRMLASKYDVLELVIVADPNGRYVGFIDVLVVFSRLLSSGSRQSFGRLAAHSP